MKKCPFMKIIETEGDTKEEIFKTCIGKDCIAYSDENRCLLIHKSEFNFIN